MQLPQKVVTPFTALAERYYPDSFVFAVIITALTFIMALMFTDASVTTTLSSWGDGLPKLLSFTAQLSITLLAAYALAHSDWVQSLLAYIGSKPKSATSAYVLVTFCAGVGSLIAWSLGLIVGATLARHIAIQARKRNIKVHYPLLVASAYAGFVIWHMGYSASAPLFVATSGHTLEQAIGIIPITETVFTLENGLLALFTLIAICILCPLMRPSEQDVVEVEFDDTSIEDEIQAKPTNSTPAQKLEHWRPLSFGLGLCLLLFIAYSFFNKGFFLTLDIVNWSLVCAGLLLARSPIHYVKLIERGSASIGPIIIQYPFYAGILGMMIGTGLVDVISAWFVSAASQDTLTLAAFLSAGLVNMFIPSGGGQWAIQGPIFIQAAEQLGVEYKNIVLAVAYGDQWTNMIQPFWTIPLLAIAGLNLRAIMGYTVLVFLVTGVIFATGLVLMN